MVTMPIASFVIVARVLVGVVPAARATRSTISQYSWTSCEQPVLVALVCFSTWYITAVICIIVRTVPAAIRVEFGDAKLDGEAAKDVRSTYSRIWRLVVVQPAATSWSWYVETLIVATCVAEAHR